MKTIVQRFEQFASRMNLTFEGGEESHEFGNAFVQFGNHSLSVRLVLDRGISYIEVADSGGIADEWYDVALIRDLLGQQGPDLLSFEEQLVCRSELVDDPRPLYSSKWNIQSCSTQRTAQDTGAKTVPALYRDVN